MPWLSANPAKNEKHSLLFITQNTLWILTAPQVETAHIIVAVTKQNILVFHLTTALMMESVSTSET
jgi:hypothetical protein